MRPLLLLDFLWSVTPWLAAGGETIPGSSYLIQLGVAGIVLLMIFIGWLWPKPAVDDMKADLERLRGQVNDLLGDWMKVLPLLNATNEMLVKLKEEERIRREREEREKWAEERAMQQLRDSGKAPPRGRPER